MNKLSNKDINNLLREAFTDAAPDKQDDIIQAAKGHNTAPTVSVTQENTRGQYAKPAALIAAASVIVIGILFILIMMNSNKAYSTVMIESDTCIEIGLSRDQRPVSINGIDNTGIQLARHIDNAQTLTQAVDNILDAMRDSGSLNENSNTVLITADAPENAQELLSASFEAAKESFDDSGYQGAILTTVASDKKEVQQLAHRHHISVGKAEMITDIIRKDKTLSSALLSRLSVNDLNLLTTFRGIRYKDIGIFGVSRGCVEPDEAIAYVCSEAGFTDSNAAVTMSVSPYGLIYSVTIHGNSRVYIYRLDAQNGEILTVSQGEDLQSAQMADKNTPTPAPTEKETESKTAATQSAGSPENLFSLLNDAQNGQTPSAVTPNPQDNRTAPTTAPPQAQQATSSPASPKPQTTQKQASQSQKQPQQQTPTQKRTTPTSAPRVTQTEKPQPATAAPKPTQAYTPTEAPKPTAAPTQPKTEPSIFTSDNYLKYSGGIKHTDPVTSAAKQISIRRIKNGYNLFYDHTDFPYSPAGTQGGISALVCNREQFCRLTGSTDSRYDDSYFKTHALYIHMNRDANYHWIKSVEAAYMQGGTLCIKNSEPVGYYITTDAANPEQIYTVVYELNKSDLEDFTNMVEYTD